MSFPAESSESPAETDVKNKSSTSFSSPKHSMNDVTIAHKKTSTFNNLAKVERSKTPDEVYSFGDIQVRKPSIRKSSAEKIAYQRRTCSSRHRSGRNRTSSPTASAITLSSTSYVSSVKSRPRAQSVLDSLTSAFTAGEFYSAERPSSRSTLSNSRKGRSGSSHYSGASRQHAIVDDYLDQKHTTATAADRKVKRNSFTSAPSTRSGSSSFSERSSGSYRAPSSRTSIDSLATSHIEESDEEYRLKKNDLLLPDEEPRSATVTFDPNLPLKEVKETYAEEERRREVDTDKRNKASNQNSCSSDSEDAKSNDQSSEAANTSPTSPPTSPESVQYEGHALGEDQKYSSISQSVGKKPSSMMNEDCKGDAKDRVQVASNMASEKTNDAHRPPKRNSRSKRSVVSPTMSQVGAVGEAYGYPGQLGLGEHDAHNFGFHNSQPQQHFGCGPYMSPTYPYEPSPAELDPPYDITHAYPSYPYQGGYMLPPPAPDYLLKYTHSSGEDRPAQQPQPTETAHQHASEISKKSSMGYDLLASRLTLEETSPGSRLRPMYRKFERLNHRVLLHLQSEINELEEELKTLDSWVAQFDYDNQQHQQQHERREGEANHPDSSRSSSRSTDPLYIAELQYRRTELLGRIFVKLGQYNQGLSVYSNMVKRFEKAEIDDVRAYQTWLAENRPISAGNSDNDTESRLLDEHEDLICLRKPGTEVHHVVEAASNRSTSSPSSAAQSRRQSRTNREDSMGTVRPQVATIGLAILLLIPFLTFHVIPSSLGRLFIVLVAIIAQGAMVASTPVGAYLSENEWVICAASYVTVAFVAGLFLWT